MMIMMYHVCALTPYVSISLQWSIQVMDMTPEEWEKDTLSGGCSGIKMWKVILMNH